MRIEPIETDLLIVGSGFAGLWAAIFRMMAATPFAAETRESLDLSRSLEDAIRIFAKHLPAAEKESPGSEG